MSHAILLPSKLKTVSEDATRGTYEIEGLYPGYGHTLGNALRRIILSSIPGAAITKIKITGADHEYSTLEGIKEDVLTMVLNLKRLRFQIDGDEAVTASLKVTGEKEVTGADFDLPGQVSLLNPDQVIALITDKKTTLEIEVTIEGGLGFVPKPINKKSRADIGVIAVDAVFTPVRKVSYEVENMRVGDRTDHNLLRVSIETDGSYTPREALEYAIKVMLQQLRAVLELKEEEENPISVADIEAEVVGAMKKDQADEAAEEGADVTEEEYTDALKTRIDSVEMSTRTQNALSEASIRTIGGLVQKTADELLSLDGIGDKGVEEIQSVLKDYGLGLKE